VYLVQVFHHRKIFWRFGLSFQQVFNKSCFIILILKRPVTDFLVTNSRTWYCSQSLATSRTRSMCWPYLHVFRQFSKALYRFIHLFGSFFLSSDQSCGFFQQIRTTNITHENEISREYHYRFVGCRMVCQQKADTFGCMSWCVQDF